MRKTKKHTVYSIEEKNKIVKRYLNGAIGYNDCLREYDISGKSVLERWLKQVRTYGTVVDRRGQKKPGDKPKGRPRKVDLNSLSKAELISIIEVYEDIKKTSAYLRVPRKNIKSSLN
jgi:transposase-like protein